MFLPEEQSRSNNDLFSRILHYVLVSCNPVLAQVVNEYCRELWEDCSVSAEGLGRGESAISFHTVEIFWVFVFSLFLFSAFVVPFHPQLI